MSYISETYKTALSTNTRSVQISRPDESGTPSNQYEQHSERRGASRQRRSNEDQNYHQGPISGSEPANQTPTVELRIDYYDSEYGANMSHNTISFKVMIIGPDECNEVLQQPRKKFEVFDVTFESSCTINDIMKKLFTTRFNKIPLTFCILYEDRTLSEDQVIAYLQLNANSVLYFLFILSNVKPAQKSNENLALLNFHELPKVSESSDVLIRVSSVNAENKIKSGIYSIGSINNTTTVKELKQRAWRLSKPIGSYYHRQLYYYGFELDNDDMYLLRCRLFEQRADRVKLPLIFDFVLTQFRETGQSPHSTNISDMQLVVNPEMNKIPKKFHDGFNSLVNIIRTGNYDNDNENVTVDDGSTYARVFRNFALIYYVRLCMHFAIKNKNETKGKHHESNSTDIIYKAEKYGLHEVLLDFYTFCDKDKSSQLDERELKMGLLTLFKFINEKVKQNNLTINSLLPIVYQNERGQNWEYYNEIDFKTLIIDTLTEDIRIQTFQGLKYSDVKDYSKFNKEIKDISDAINNTIEDHLRISSKDEDESPFSVLKIIGFILLFPLSFIILPIIVCVSLILIMREKNYPLINKKGKTASVINIIFIIVCTLLSCVIYLIFMNLILFHAYYQTNSDWRVSLLEVYWPLALIIYMVAIYYLYLYEKLAPHEIHRKRDKVEQTYNDAEIEMLKAKALVTTTDGERMTLADYESSKSSSSDEKPRTPDKNKNIFTRIYDFIKEIYNIEFKTEKVKFIIAKIILLIFALGLAVTHTCVPVIYRNYFSNTTDPNTTKPFQTDMIKISYFIWGFPLYLIFLLMVLYAFHKYKILHGKIQKILRQTVNNSRYNGPKTNDYYLNLKNPDNLDLFLALIRSEYQMNSRIEYRVAFASMAGALVFDLLLAIFSFVRLIYYGPGGLATLTSVYALIDMIILSLLIISFLIGIAVINTATTTDVLELLLRTKKEALSVTSPRPKDHLNWDINYLTATSEYLTENRHLYSVTLFTKVVDLALVTKLGLSMLAGIVSALISVVKKETGLSA